MEVLSWLIAVVALFAALVVGPMVVVVGAVVAGCSGSATVCKCSARCRTETKPPELSTHADNANRVGSIVVACGRPD